MAAEPTWRPARHERLVTYIDRLLPHVPLHRVLARSVECLVLSDLPPLDHPALDLGCGDGSFAAALSAQPLTAGIDSDARAVREAARRRVFCDVATASGAALPFRDGVFASVLCNSTLEHIADADAVLEEAVRVIRPGGRFLLTVPSERFFSDHLGAAVPGAGRLYERWIAVVAKVRHAHSPGEWQARLEAAGCRVLDWRYYFTAGSMRAMDAAQYISAPALLTKHLLGRWVIWPTKGRLLPLAEWLSRFAREGDGSQGSFLLFHCERVERPVQ